MEPVVLAGRRRLGEGWVQVGHGLHRTDAATDLHAWQLALPSSGRFTHLSAAAARGWALPPVPDGTPAFALVNRVDSRPQRIGLVVARAEAPPDPVILGGLRLDPSADVLVACARDLGTLDLVVLADSAIRLGHTTHAELTLAASVRRRGAPALRRALPLVDPRADSPYETLLRVLHHVCAVDVVPQFELLDADGHFLAQADLWLRGTTALHEYDGGDHLEVRQQRKDLARARRINNRAWTRRGYTAADVLHQGIGILRDADLSLGRTHEPSRIRAWHRLLAESLFTPGGRERFRRRVAQEPRRNG